MIREYEDKDVTELLDAWYSASQVGHPFLTEDFFEQERKNILALYLPNAETWVFELDGMVVGFIALIGDEVGALFVHSQHHRRGIGKQLMDHARSIRESLCSKTNRPVATFTRNMASGKYTATCTKKPVTCSCG